MKKYDVTVRAIVTKTYFVEAEDEDAAVDIAHETFSVLNDGIDENYDQDIVSIEELE